MQSGLGGGAHGHLALTVLPKVFDALSVTPFVIPLNSGPAAITAPSLTTSKITSTQLDHSNAATLFIKHQNTDKVLK